MWQSEEKTPLVYKDAQLKGSVTKVPRSGYTHTYTHTHTLTHSLTHTYTLTYTHRHTHTLSYTHSCGPDLQLFTELAKAYAEALDVESPLPRQQPTSVLVSMIRIMDALLPTVRWCVRAYQMIYGV